jgi:phosphoenolpyruvate-protein kinase (PTS system EI component)
MKLIHFPSVLAGTVLLFTSCERRSETVVETRVEEPIKAEPVSATTTFETAGLDRAIETYRTNPTEQNKAAVDKAFAELDAEIAELKQKAATSSGNEKIETERKLADLQAYRDKQRANYAGEKAEDAAASAGEAIKDATEEVGRAIEKTGDAIKKAVD